MWNTAAAAAKSLQSCPTLCDLMDWSPPGSSVHGIFQARVLEWGATAFSKSSILHLKSFTNSSNVPWKIPRTWNCYCFSHQVVSDSVTPWKPGLPVPHHLPEFAQVHVHRSGDAIQPCHVTLFSFCFQSFLASGSFPMSWLFASGGQSTGASASASVLPTSIQSWYPLGLTGLISLLSKGLSTTVWIMLSRAPDWHTKEFEGLFLKFLIKKKRGIIFIIFRCITIIQHLFMSFYFPIVRLICTERRVSQMYV